MIRKTGLFLFFFTAVWAWPQIAYSSYVNPYLFINSYSGQTNPDAYNIMLSGNGNFNVPNWRLSVKLTAPISAPGTQYTMSAEKVLFRPVSTSGQGSDTTPAVGAIGIPSAVYLTQNSEVFLVPKSNASLLNQPSSPSGYYNLNIKFSLTVLGGSYLGAYPPWITFNAPLEFTAYDQYNNIIGRMLHTMNFHIGILTGTPPADQMTVQFSPAAVNGSLEFKTLQDYREGTRATYPGGLIVSSNTNYQVKVRSMQPQFVSPAGSVLPLNAVSMSLSTTAVGAGHMVYPVQLSSAPQVVAKGTASSSGSKITYDISYYTAASDQRFINARMENYSTSLQFEVIAQ